MSEIGNKVGQVKTLYCSEPNCDFAIAVGDNKKIIKAVKEVFDEHTLVMSDRNFQLGPPPRFFPFDVKPGEGSEDDS